MEIYYRVINENGEIVGNVFTENYNSIIVTNKVFESKHNSMEDVFIYLKNNKLHLIDMQGDLYSKTIHDEVVRKINMFGTGYFYNTK